MPKLVRMTDVEGDSHWVNLNMITEIKKGTYHHDRFVLFLSDRRRIVMLATMLPGVVLDQILGQ